MFFVRFQDTSGNPRLVNLDHVREIFPGEAADTFMLRFADLASSEAYDQIQMSGSFEQVAEELRDWRTYQRRAMRALDEHLGFLRHMAGGR